LDVSTYVVKKYSKEILDSLIEFKETPKTHAQKSVQMHQL